MAKQLKSTSDSTSTKKPLVNWFSRTKEKSKTNSDSTFSSSKKVTAPESVLSRGFKKEKSYKAQFGDVNDSTSYGKYESSRVKEKMPNAKGGGGKKVSYSKSSSVYGNDKDSTFSKKYEERTRKPSQGMSGVSKVKYNVTKNDSTIADYDKKTRVPKLSNSGKTPLTNWSNRTKEITKEYPNGKSDRNNTITITTKKVSTPKSSLSSGFEKSKVKKTKDRNMGLLTAAGMGTAASSMAIPDWAAQNTAQAIGGGLIAADMVRSKIPKTLSKTKTKKRTK
jgi:hypothetical protein